MRRSKELLEKRKKFVADFVVENHNKQMKTIVLELQDRLFISERTIYNIMREVGDEITARVKRIENGTTN